MYKIGEVYNATVKCVSVTSESVFLKGKVWGEDNEVVLPATIEHVTPTDVFAHIPDLNLKLYVNIKAQTSTAYFDPQLGRVHVKLNDKIEAKAPENTEAVVAAGESTPSKSVA